VTAPALTVDVGNSSIGIGTRDSGRWTVQRVREPEEAAALIRESAATISVSPARLERLQQALRERGLAPLRLLQRPPPAFACVTPSLMATAGADRLANALALWPGPGIAVDAGTAITIDVVDGAGVYQGGFIAAGPSAAAIGLAAVTAQLPRVHGVPVPLVPGRSTTDALGAGLWGAAVGGVDRLVQSALCAMAPGGKVRLVATGGWGAEWAAASTHQGIVVDPDFIHRGIARWAGWG
jgi:type III pantothenate kinase